MTFREKYQQSRDELLALRDMAQVQAHLFSLDARKRWSEIETALESAELMASREGEEAAENATMKLKKVTSIGQQLVRELLASSKELTARASSLMTPKPVICGPLDSLDQAAKVMWEQNCGAVPVVSQDGKLLGMITDRDVAMSGYLTGQRISDVQVASAMSKGIISAESDSTLADILTLMGQHQLHRVPIVNGTGRLVGIIALADVARSLVTAEASETCRSLVATLTSISTPSKRM